ncbi:MAG: restriction endonuclease S subunit [Francisella sp.]|jgi:restriction endonuclease S subunit
MKLSNIAEISIGILIFRYKYNSANDSKKISYSLFSQNMLSDSGIFQTYKPDMFISTKDLSASCTKEGDIIFGLRKPNQAVYINEDNTNLLVQSYMAIIRCNTSVVLPEYLAFKLNTADIQNQLFKSVQGGSMIQLLKVSHLRDISIDIPSIEKQKRLITILKTGYSEIELLENIMTEKQKLLKAII